jgi:hypothetical protein
LAGTTQVLDEARYEPTFETVETRVQLHRTGLNMCGAATQVHEGRRGRNEKVRGVDPRAGIGGTGPFLILAAVLALPVAGANLATAEWSGLGWGAGLVTGMAIAMFMGQTSARWCMVTLSRIGRRTNSPRIATDRVEQVAEAVGATWAERDLTWQSSGQARP